LFRRGKQLASGKNLNPSGVGMGLYISKLIMKKLSGRLELEGHKDGQEGSIFSIELKVGARP
jgi:K+-sensing histidine kinase KdpD